jgi:hypothetical protein
MDKRKCIFCDSIDLSREHIFSKWIFNLFSTEEKVFKPSFNILERSNSNDFTDSFLKDTSDGREIRYDDFTLKQVCKSCNNGWMSDLEVNVQTIYKNQLIATFDLNEINPDDAIILAQWTILKVMLTSLTCQEKVVFSSMAYTLIRKGVIPEGFIVEVSKMKYKKLNYTIGGPIVRKCFDISREELDVATRNFFIACLQIGEIAFRISFLRTDIPVFRKQIIKKLFVLYPYKSQMPFEEQPDNDKDYEEKLELPLLSSMLAIID